MQEQFPHVLSYSKGVIRFISSKEVSKGDTIFEKSLTGVHGQHFKIDQIQLIRKAKGQWANWPVHPDYYEAKAHCV